MKPVFDCVYRYRWYPIAIPVLLGLIVILSVLWVCARIAFDENDGPDISTQLI